ncbi:MAG: hypothetical protein OIF57_04210 [Marinobacterium sp.]|nr:hypothetical protein [Marinobacterium sp.]
MSVQKSALPERVRVVKYFETLQDGEKVCVSPSAKPMDAPEDKALLQELLDGGLVVAVDESEETG